MLDSGKDGKIQIAILLNVIGDEGVSVFNTFRLEDGESKEKFYDVIKKFENHCLPQSNEALDASNSFAALRKMDKP